MPVGCSSFGICQLRSSHHKAWVSEIGYLVAPEVTGGAENNFKVVLKYLARIFCKKNWPGLLFSGRNGGSNIVPPPIGGRHRLLCFMTNIKVTNMKNTAGKSARGYPPNGIFP